MSETYRIIKNGKYIKADCFQFGGFDDVKILADALLKACCEYNCLNIMICNYSASHLSPHHSIFIVEYLSKINFGRHCLIAIVNPQEGSIHENDRFLITAAENRGWYNIKLFSEMNSAKKWFDKKSCAEINE